jgi:pilus assembly protein CpaF
MNDKQMSAELPQRLPLGGGLKLTTYGTAPLQARTKEEVFAEMVAVVQKSFNDDGVLTEEEKITVRTSPQVRRKAIHLAAALIQKKREQDAADTEVHREWPAGTPEELGEQVYQVLYGLGPIDELLRREDIEDIAINGPHEIMLRTSAGWKPAEGELVRTLNSGAAGIEAMFKYAISGETGKQPSRTNPIVDAHLPSGDRISYITQPVADDSMSPLAVIRRHRRVTFTIGDFLDRAVTHRPPLPVQIPDYRQSWVQGALLSPAAATLLHMAVHAGLNILLLGRTGVGKTSFLNMLGRFIPGERRVLVLEDTRELDLRPGDTPRNCVYMTTTEATAEGGVSVSMSQLVKAALRQRPDALVLGEARGAEMWDLLNAMQTGHGGNLTSVHAISADNLLERVQNMVAQAGQSLSQEEVSRYLAGSFHLVITLLMDHNGRRYIPEIAAFTGRLVGTRPEYEYLFRSGPENGYFLELQCQESQLERHFLPNGLTFRQVVDVAGKGV